MLKKSDIEKEKETNHEISHNNEDHTENKILLSEIEWAIRALKIGKAKVITILLLLNDKSKWDKWCKCLSSLM